MMIKYRLNTISARSRMTIAAQSHKTLPIVARKKGHGCCENTGDNAIHVAPVNTNILANHLNH